MVICNPGMVQSVKTEGSWEKIGKDQRPIMLHLCSMHLVKPHVFKQLRKYVTAIFLANTQWSHKDTWPWNGKSDIQRFLATFQIPPCQAWDQRFVIDIIFD